MTQTIVVTGANRGIGLSLVQYYLAQGHRVLAVCRQRSPALEASGAIIIDDVDVAVDADIQHLQQTLESESIDLLINNAGILGDEQLEQLDADSIRLQFEVNALAPLRVTAALQSQLKKGAKVALITSRMGSITDNSSGGRYGYRMSKAALNAAGKSLAVDFKPQGIAVAILHPGLVATDMIGGQGDLTPDEAAARLAQRITQLTLDNSGTFWHSNGEELPW